MSDRIVVNPGDLTATAKLMDSARGELQLLARRIVSDDMPEMPASITAQVRTGAARTSATLFRNSNELESFTTDLRRRAIWAELASASAGTATLTTLRHMLHRLDKRVPKKHRKRRNLPDPKQVKGDPKKKRWFKIRLKSEGFLPREVNQGLVGDCYFASAVSSMASTRSGRARLRQMIKRNGDGTFTVKFADGKKVTVDADLYMKEGQIAYGDGSPVRDGTNKPNWFSILEKAYAKRRGSYDVLDKGGFACEAWQALRGGSPDKMSVTSKTTPKEVWQKINGQLHPKKGGEEPVVVDIYSPPLDSLPAGSGHAFSVLDCYTQKDKQWVIVRNPWGFNNGQAESDLPTMKAALLKHGAKFSNPDNGVFKINVKDFTKLVGTIENG